MKRWLAFLPLIAIVALAVLFAGYALHRNPHIEPQALVGRPAPDLTLPALETGEPTPIRSTVKGPTLINFFASWCVPCELEHPQLMALKDEGVRIVGVAYKDAPENSRAFIGRLGDPFAVKLIDRDGRAGVEFGTTGVPETYLVAPDGKIIAKHSGPLDAASAEALLAKARG
ncbi:MAG: DsbE family thiol:disulfide interchange protein [Ignavibacteriales bacterium]